MVHISEDFTPVVSLAGGALIGTAASLNLALNGRTTGLSSTLSGVLQGSEGLQWRAMILSGLGIAAAATQVLAPDTFGNTEETGMLLPLTAGLLVGFGTQLGSGCTSGHGICGLAFLSPRSALAVATFMVTGSATSIAAAKTHSFGLDSLLPAPIDSIPSLTAIIGTVSLLAAVTVPMDCFSRYLGEEERGDKEQPLIAGLPSSSSRVKAPCSSLMASLATGLIFGGGLAISGMLDSRKVVNFLNLTGDWDPSLLMVMGGGAAVTMTSFRLILKRQKPLLMPAWSYPTRRDLTSDLVIGAGIFGIGWGLGGICPGPGFMGLASGKVSKLMWFAGLAVGFRTYSRFTTVRNKLWVYFKKSSSGAHETK